MTWKFFLYKKKSSLVVSWCLITHDERTKVQINNCYKRWDEDVHLLASDGVHNVVDLQNGPNRLAREGDGASTDQERLNNILIQNIGNSSLENCF